MTYKDFLLQSLFAFAQILGYTDLHSIHFRMCSLLQSPSNHKLIVVPRGYFKTSIASVAYPLWLAARNPNIRILLVAKSADNASRRVRLIRKHILTNSFLHKFFPHLLPDNPNKTKWNDTNTTVKRTKEFLEGTFEAAGTGTSLPSRHYDVIIEDDIIAAEKDDMTEEQVMPNPAEIAKAVGFHKMLPTLLTPPIEKGIVVHIATRWDRQDVVNYILTNEPYYETLVSGIVDEDGNPTFPEFYPMPIIERLRSVLGPSMFAMQYENQPLSESDYMVQPGQIIHYQTPPQGLSLGIVVDPAISAKRKASQAVVLVAGLDSSNKLFILDYVAKRGLSPTKLCNIIIRFHKQYSEEGKHYVKVGMETVAYQQALSFILKEKMEAQGYWFNINELKPIADKNTRIMRLQPYAADGRLFVREGLVEFTKQAYDYPASRAFSYDLLDAAAYIPELLKPPKAVIPVQTADRDFSYDDILKRLGVGQLSRKYPFPAQQSRCLFRHSIMF